MNPPLVEALRGNAIESTHSGAVAIVDAEGAIVTAIGDVDRPIFPRSAVKVLQALPMLVSGAAERLQLSDDELAIVCASHNGEPEHVQVVAGLLAKVGLDEHALECGTHWPSHETTARALAAAGGKPNALHNNCSGKHAGFLCLGCMQHGEGGLRDHVKGYVAADHPVMREVTAALQATTGFDLATAPRGTDGCSIPTFAIPLRHLAHAFARIGTGIGLSPDHAAAARRLRGAVAKAPFMVAGTRRFDTKVMLQLGERAFTKVGAEGVFCAALPEQGLGVAIKIDDGNNARAAEVVMAAVIEACGALDDTDATFMRSLSDVKLRNWNGIEVGALRATADLRRALPGR